MAVDEMKEEIANVVELALRSAYASTAGASRMVLRVDYRTLVLRIPADEGPTRDFQLQVKEMY